MYRKSAVIAVGVSLLINGLPVAGYAYSPPACTIVGTTAADRITGTAGDDVICAGAGNDVITGLGGNDIIYAGPGNDRVLGGKGQDEIFGETGNDKIDGGEGADKLVGGEGKDGIIGGNGQDTLQGGAGPDQISAGNGADVIDGGQDRDTITTGAGNDLCKADPADVRLDSCGMDSKGPKFGAIASVVKQFQAGTLATFSVNVSDLATVEAVYGSIGGAPGWITEWCGFRIPTELVSGTEKSGTYKLSCPLPQNAVNGNYTLFVGAVDLMGNLAEERIAFEVVGGSTDNLTPNITSLDLPETVDPAENFVIRVEATDDSGVVGMYVWFLLEGGGFSNENGLHAKGSEPRVISSSTTESIFEQDYYFSEGAPQGRYRVWISIRDGVGNREFMDTGRFITLVK